MPTEHPRGEKMPEMRRFEGEYRESSTEKQRHGQLFNGTPFSGVPGRGATDTRHAVK
jgi:hypothetical protein